MIDVDCGLRSTISSLLTAVSRPWTSAKTSDPSGVCSNKDAREDCPVGQGHAPGDKLGRDLLARREDRFHQSSPIHTGGQGGEIRACPAAPAVDLVTAIAAGTLGVKKTRSPAAASAGPSRRPSQPSRSVTGGRLVTVVFAAEPAAMARLSSNSSEATSPWLAARSAEYSCSVAQFPAGRGSPRAVIRAAGRSPTP